MNELQIIRYFAIMGLVLNLVAIGAVLFNPAAMSNSVYRVFDPLVGKILALAVSTVFVVICLWLLIDTPYEVHP